MKMNKTVILVLVAFSLMIQPVFAFSFLDWFSRVTDFLTSTVSSPPKVISIEAVPQKVKPGEIMLTIIEVEDNYGIEEAYAEIPHEKGFDRVKMELVSGTSKRGKWQAEWKEHDALNEKWYITVVHVINEKGKVASAEIDWQDPTVSHPASEITAGTFDSGDFTFPGNLNVNGLVKIGSIPSTELYNNKLTARWSNTAIFGESTLSGIGVYGLAAGGPGVFGTSRGSQGVWGTSSCCPGVKGEGVLGVMGISTADCSNPKGCSGVYGVNINGIGVKGSSINGWAGYFDGKVYMRDNVGVGTENPTEKLHVAGNVKANQFITGDIAFQKDGEKLWRMFEDEDGLYLENLKTGKLYRFALEELK